MSSTRHARAGAGLRLLRAAVFTAVCVVLSATGHVLAACEAVALWTLVAGSAGVFALVVPFAGRERSLPAIAAVLTAGQLGLHSLFAIGQSRLHLAQTADEALIRTAAKLVCGAGAASLTPSDARRIVTTAGIDPAAHTGHAHLAEAAATGPEAPSLAMVLGHLLAGIATGLLLRRGDAALLRLMLLSAGSAHEVAGAARLRALRAAVVLVRALCAGLPGAPERLPRPSAHTAGPPPPAAGEVLQHTVIRRGPPRVFVLSA
ncbi:hypothetical protein HW130_10750 [Streptomyces sp. PKU-EA00015]|uniref:hypothetical protein n=1 Tax=Streptomyces sp. PKU-EA00015 TaxID=2748326 RepID=UPI0015A23290|nr:hypothetical protein [Streptomyces sp. PKU-EA00015]NWF26744.1 hypothetical protein [Streptomyces sp. PKU-EA00015]